MTRKCLVTCWVAVLFLLLLTDDTLSRKPKFRFNVGFRSGRSSSHSKTKFGLSKPSSLSWKPALRNPGFSPINFGSNKPWSSFRESDLFTNTPNISAIFIRRRPKASPNKPGSSQVKPGFPTENHPYNHIYSLHNPAYEQDSDFFPNMPNFSQIMLYNSRMQDLLQKVRESSPNKPGSSTVGSGSSMEEFQRRLAYVQNSDFYQKMLNVSQIASSASSLKEILQKVRAVFPN